MFALLLVFSIAGFCLLMTGFSAAAWAETRWPALTDFAFEIYLMVAYLSVLFTLILYKTAEVYFGS